MNYDLWMSFLAPKLTKLCHFELIPAYCVVLISRYSGRYKAYLHVYYPVWNKQGQPTIRVRLSYSCTTHLAQVRSVQLSKWEAHVPT